jgi:hypothetical protein
MTDNLVQRQDIRNSSIQGCADLAYSAAAGKYRIRFYVRIYRDFMLLRVMPRKLLGVGHKASFI